MVQPLVDAGLVVDEICGLLFGLAFPDLVTTGLAPGDSAHRLVLDRPATVRAAWLETVDRMITFGP